MAKRRMKAINALELAIERERGANKFYLQAANMTADPDGAKMFRCLAKQEVRHQAKLRQQLKSVQERDRWLEWRSRTSLSTGLTCALEGRRGGQPRGRFSCAA